MSDPYSTSPMDRFPRQWNEWDELEFKLELAEERAERQADDALFECGESGIANVERASERFNGRAE